MCRAVIGIEMEITRLEGKRKASQHKPAEERQGIGIYGGLRHDSGFGAEDAALLSGHRE